MPNERSLDVKEREKQYSDDAYKAARAFFHGSPRPFAAPGKNDLIANDEGTIQFHLIGQQTNIPMYSGIMNENQDNLLAIGGLIYDYMHSNFPVIDSKVLDLTTWANVLSNIPDLAIGQQKQKFYSQRAAGTSVSATFLSLIAQAIITDGASLLTDFESFLTAMGDITFSANAKAQQYRALTCTYQSYLLDNGAGGYYDYGAIVLRQIEFKQNFLELKSCCSSTRLIDVDLGYTEITSVVQARRIRKGGPDHENFQQLVNANSTSQFKRAENFFNGGSTPQHDIKPQV
ncbi:hypothetical protein C7I87_06565 [Mesorhizobium sp. SARCC-RB16n]|uniref:hypothetical protein n=1 Tax=Mesorhizobium sp. SARCC-RB16n TaxID=2116687 RepID=UPI00122F8D7A|nr:hypothetical protein [Mesorhizobium sp. SARCC-RB16n]KAA3451660.1 hypothetical protein C7I87_06565 [Mesorhizobium sp. SARCC-RB16n]